MNLDHLKAFIAVADLHSFTAAAQVLHISKQSVSRRIGELEDELGMALLVRSTRRVSLSDDGAVFAEHARRALGELEDGVQNLRARLQDPAGELWVSAPSLFLRQFLNPVIQRFLRTHRRMRVMLCSLGDADTLSFDHSDVIVSVGPLPDVAAKRITLGQAVNGCFAAPSYVAARGAPQHPEELRSHECLFYTRHRGRPDTWRLDKGEESVTVPIQARLKSNDVDSILDAVVAGMGIGHLPLFFCREHVRDGTLVPVLPEWHLPIGPICALYRDSRAPRVGLDLLLAAVREELSQKLSGL